MPVVASEIERQQPAYLREYFNERLAFYRDRNKELPDSKSVRYLKTEWCRCWMEPTELYNQSVINFWCAIGVLIFFLFFLSAFLFRFLRFFHLSHSHVID
ncbi:DNA polymerase III subunit theta [Proteus terrae]|uniref:DNA polymerase III subunit theta n=1 Tax=Proteus terrae TaxID=1574161 RepID=UPI00301D6AA7